MKSLTSDEPLAWLEYLYEKFVKSLGKQAFIGHTPINGSVGYRLSIAAGIGMTCAFNTPIDPDIPNFHLHIPPIAFRVLRLFSCPSCFKYRSKNHTIKLPKHLFALISQKYPHFFCTFCLSCCLIIMDNKFQSILKKGWKSRNKKTSEQTQTAIFKL